MAYTLYDVLKYSLVPKITTVFERINAVYELSYAILMVFGPLLSLFLMKAMYIAPLLPLASILIFFNMSKKVEYRPFRSTYSFLSSSRKIFLNKSFRLVSLMYLILTSAGSLVNLAIIQVSQKFYLTEIFIELCFDQYINWFRLCPCKYSNRRKAFRIAPSGVAWLLTSISISHYYLSLFTHSVGCRAMGLFGHISAQRIFQLYIDNLLSYKNTKYIYR